MTPRDRRNARFTHGAKDQKETSSRIKRKQHKSSTRKTKQQRPANMATPENPKVSEHALLRYLERIIGFNIAEANSIILSEGVRDHMRVGARSFVVDGIRYRTQNNTIVTVMVEGD